MTLHERRKKEYKKLSAKRGKNIRFEELVSLSEMHGWTLNRVAQNSHYIYTHPGYEGIVNVPKPHGEYVLPVYCRNALAAIEEVAGYD